MRIHLEQLKNSIVELEFLSVGTRLFVCFFFFQAEDGIRDLYVTGVQTCALPILEEVVGEHEGGAPRQQELWTLLVFEHWHRAFATASAGAKTFAAVCSFDHASERL